VRHIFIEDLEFRERSGEQFFSGYAAVFNEDFHLFANVFERFDPKAFDNIGVVQCWYDHKSDMVLGSTAIERSLTLTVDEKGLYYEQKFNGEDADHVYVRAKIRSGLCKGSSLGFGPTKQRWIKEGNKSINVIDSCSVRDLGPTCAPCYTSTTAQVRSSADIDEARKSFETWKRISNLKA